MVSVLTASGGTPAVSRCFGQRVLDLLNRQWPRRESPDFPAHSWAERPNSSAERQSSSAPHLAKLACGTDICPAESGGSHGRSAERSVAGSPDFFAKRSAVGSHVGIAFPRRLFCARRSHRLRAQAELHSALRSDTPPSAVVSGPILSRPDQVQGRHILLLPERM